MTRYAKREFTPAEARHYARIMAEGGCHPDDIGLTLGLSETDSWRAVLSLPELPKKLRAEYREYQQRRERETRSELRRAA